MRTSLQPNGAQVPSPPLTRCLSHYFVSLYLWLALLPAFTPARASYMMSAPSGVRETGIPPFTIFSGESFGLQTPPFDLNELPDGRIIIIGANELVVGDGVRWELIQKSPLEPDYLAGQVTVDDTGGIWASRTEGFCKIEFNSHGQWHFGEPIKLPDHEHRQWPAFILNRRINGQDYWFGSALVAWTPGAKQIPRVLSSGISIDHLFPLAGKLYATSPGNGNVLQIQADGSCSNLFGAQHKDPGSSILCSASLDSSKVLVGTVLNGVQVFDGTTLTPLVKTGPLAGGARISDICRTKGGYFAAAIDAYGIVFFDQEGRIIQALDRSVDHRFGQVKRLLRRSDGSLWALFTRGIIRIEFPSRISYIDPMLSTGADYVSPVRHKGHLWLIATGKLLKAVYEEQRLTGFEADSPPSPFVYTLISVNGRLIAGCTEGVYERLSSGWKLIHAEISNARLVYHKPGSAKWLYVARQEIGWIDLASETPIFERVLHPELTDSYNSFSDTEGDIWLELGASKVGRISFTSGQPELKIFSAADGIAGGWAELFIIDETVRVNCSGRTLRFVSKTQRFEADAEVVLRYPELLGTIGGRPTRDSRNRLWIPKTDFVRIVQDSYGSQDRRVENLPAELKPGNFICEPNGIVWMQERLRFARYDPSVEESVIKNGAAIITRVEQPTSGRTYISPGKSLPEISPDDNTLITHFAASSVPFGERVTFEFRIDGMGDQWAPTGVTGSTLLNRLKEGAYTLRVRPILIGGPGEEANLYFVVRPPWYRTLQAYVSYGIICGTLIAGAIIIPLYYERRRKAYLSLIVTERTQELTASQERYRSLNTELEQRVEERTRELDLSTARLRIANQELESFSYSISHDLRAPLRNITGFIELMDRKLKQGNMADCTHPMEVVISEAKRMASLIEDLLVFSRLSRSEMKNEEVDLHILWDECRRELSHELETRDINWTLDQLPTVSGDRALLRQVLANLIGNAVKFTRHRKRADIRFYCDATPGSDGLLFFHIKDNGAGFNPKYASKLFGVFQRLHSSKDFEGTGIGLANVKRIVSRHGGQVYAEGALDAGATVSFSLKPWSKTTQA